MRWCRCTSSSQGRCWPGTIGRSYTAASSSEPSSRRCRRYQSPSPAFKQQPFTNTQTNSSTRSITMFYHVCEDVTMVHSEAFHSHLLCIWILCRVSIFFPFQTWEPLTVLSQLLLHTAPLRPTLTHSHVNTDGKVHFHHQQGLTVIAVLKHLRTLFPLNTVFDFYLTVFQDHVLFYSTTLI